MIIDALLQLSGTYNPTAGQSLVGAAQTIVSTNVIDTAGVGVGNTARDIGMGESLEVALEMIIAAAGGTAVDIRLVEADDAAISVNVQTIVSTGAIPIASLTAGTTFALHWDRAQPYPARRYIALQYVTTGTWTTGTIMAAVVKNVQDKGNNTIFNSGFAVQ